MSKDYKRKIDTYALQSGGGVSVKRDFQNSHNTAAVRTSHYTNVKTYDDLTDIVDKGDAPSSVEISGRTVNLKSRQATMLSGNRAVVVDTYQNKRKGNKQPAQINSPTSMTVFSFGMRSLKVEGFALGKNESLILHNKPVTLDDKWSPRPNNAPNPHDIDVQYFLIKFPFVLSHSPFKYEPIVKMAGKFNDNQVNIGGYEWPRAHARFGISDVTTHEITGSRGTSLQYVGSYTYWLCPKGGITNGFRKMVPVMDKDGKGAMLLVPLGPLTTFVTPSF